MASLDEDLLQLIEEAFARVQLDDGDSLNMTEYNDSGGCMPHFAKKARDDERDDWRKIPDQTLEKFTVTFSFTDLKGFRFYIPAYMRWTVRNHHSSDSIISDSTIYAINADHYLFEEVAFLDWFTESQVAAMVQFLEFAVRNEETLDEEVAQSNLDRIREVQQRSGHRQWWISRSWRAMSKWRTAYLRGA